VTLNVYTDEDRFIMQDLDGRTLGTARVLKSDQIRIDQHELPGSRVKVDGALNAPIYIKGTLNGVSDVLVFPNTGPVFEVLDDPGLLRILEKEFEARSLK
jgi:hypothetical protein